MRKHKLACPSSLVALLICLSGTIEARAAAPALPATPAPVIDVLHAQPFQLEQPFAFSWRKERPLVTEGIVLVLKVDPALVYPRQTAEPVLYVGDQTAERVNVGYSSGHVVAIVPAHENLSTSPVWFGTPALPEQIDKARIAEERKKADDIAPAQSRSKDGVSKTASEKTTEDRGIHPLTKEQWHALVTKSGPAIKVADRYELGVKTADLVAKYAPDEVDLVRRLRIPRMPSTSENQKTSTADDRPRD